MMRTLVAILAVSPALTFAQTTQPAQPRSTPVLSSTLLQPALLHAAVVTDRTEKSSPLPVSTGVIAPHILHTVEFTLPNDAISKHATSMEHRVIVNMTIDETGKPTNLSIAKSAGLAMDQQVLATVSQYRYQPAMLDGQPIMVPVTLEVVIPRTY